MNKINKIEEMNSRINELNSEISKIKRNINNNDQNCLNDNKNNNIAFDGIDEIIKDINNIQVEFERDKNTDDEDYSSIKTDIKRNNFANFVFYINQNLNNGKNGSYENDKDFGIEPLTKRKPFGDFNFD